MESFKLSNSKLIASGLIMVNIPVTIIILLVIYFLTTYTNFRFTLSVIIGVATGWIYWELGSRFWIKWALEKGVEKNRLHKIGIMSLVLWQSDLKKIEKIASSLSKNE